MYVFSKNRDDFIDTCLRHNMYKNCPTILTVSGFAVLAFGTIGTWHIFPAVVKSQIHKNIDLVEGTQAYTFWKKQPFPLKFKITFFNVTNAAEVQTGAKPIVKEIGPYVYDEFIEREKVVTDEQRDLLIYYNKKTFFFNKNDSGYHDQDDVVTILNAALVGTALQVNLLLPSALPMISLAIPYLFPAAKDIFLTAKVRDILFDGIRLYCRDPAVDTVCTAMQGALPKTIAKDGTDFLFSMFSYMNGTSQGPFEIGRGLKNTTRGQIYSWEEHDKLENWSDDYCNQINGSDSTLFETISGSYRKPRLYSFQEDFCRSLYVSYEKESSEFGLPSVRYATKEESLADIPENHCFCPVETDDEGDDHLKCPPSGVADITACLKAPIVITYPHFYLADPKLREYVSGMDPQKDLHENYVNLEPRTGTPLSGRKRIQMNIEVRKLDGFELLENISQGIFPLIWIEEGVTLPDNVSRILVSNLAKIGILNVTQWAFVVIGVALVATSFTLVMKREKLLCFANEGIVVDIAPPNNLAPRRSIPPAYETNSVLYPQLDNKNITGQFIQRNLSQHPWNTKAWN